MPAKGFLAEVRESVRHFYAKDLRGEVSDANVRGYLRAHGDGAALRTRPRLAGMRGVAGFPQMQRPKLSLMESGMAILSRANGCARTPQTLRAGDDV